MEESRLESYLATNRVHFWLERKDASERRAKRREEQRIRAEKTTLMEWNQTHLHLVLCQNGDTRRHVYLDLDLRQSSDGFVP